MMKKIISTVMLMMMLMCVTEVNAQWSVTPEVGMNVTKYKGVPSAIGFKAGAAVSYTFESGLFSLQSGLYYVQRGTGKTYSGFAYGTATGVDGKSENRYVYFTNHGMAYGGSGSMTGYYGQGNMGYGSGFFSEDIKLEGVQLSEASSRNDYLQLPVLARFNWKIGQDVKLHIAAGPYFAYGIGGKGKYKDMDMTKNGYSETEESFNPFVNTYFKRFDWGLMFNAGIEVKRFTLNASYDLGLGKQYSSDNMDLKYQTVSFTVGYRF